MNNLIIGTKIISGVDESRKEKLGFQTGYRKVSARIYYPAKYNGEKKVEFLKKSAGEMYDNAEIYTDKKLPLIVYSHGYGSYIESNNKLCCELAANGFFVVSVGHSYEADSIVMEDGEVIKLDKTIRKKQINPMLKGLIQTTKLKKVTGAPEEMYKKFDVFQKTYCKFMIDRLPEWAGDIEFIVDKLKEQYSDYINFDIGVGITGHSFGGNTAYYLCMNSERYVCGANIDGGIFGDYIGQRMKKPFLQICHKGNESVVSRALFDTDASVEYEVFNNVSHMGFTDMKFYNKSKIMMGSMSADEMFEKLKTLHINFFQKYLKI